tara:strand:+ start:63 stop:710 length:648 start_codon:yes stop_codon:yes gene_type:complete
MLKAAIVYLQGSGGNLLSRTLSLSEQTVAYLPAQYAKEQPTMEVIASDRFKYYNNWNSTNWISTETDIRIWYHNGTQDFVNYEITDKWLVDSFHPAMFESELIKKVLFETEKSWEHLIFIRYNNSSLPVIEKLAKLKRIDMNHISQIKNTEITIFNKLIECYPAHYVNWEDMLDLSTYIIAIKELATKLKLILDYSLVEQLWTSWNIETMKILHE